MIAIPLLRDAAAFCEEQKDFVSGDLVQKFSSTKKSTSIG